MPTVFIGEDKMGQVFGLGSGKKYKVDKKGNLYVTSQDAEDLKTVGFEVTEEKTKPKIFNKDELADVEDDSGNEEKDDDSDESEAGKSDAGSEDAGDQGETDAKDDAKQETAKESKPWARGEKSK